MLGVLQIKIITLRIMIIIFGNFFLMAFFDRLYLSWILLFALHLSLNCFIESSFNFVMSF